MNRLIILFLLVYFSSLSANSTNLKIDPNLKKYLTQEEISYIKSKKVINVSNEFDYEPMDFNINGIPVGYSIDLINILSKKAGLKVNYITQSWVELLKNISIGKIDLMHTIYKSDAREKSMYFSQAYLIGNNSFILRKEDADISRLKQLEGKKIAVSKGWIEDSIVSRYPKIQKLYFNDLKKKLEALSSGKVDAIMNDKNIANYYIKKYGFTNLKISNNVLEIKNGELDSYYFATLKEQSILISILNKSYIYTDIDTLNKLQENWFGSVGKSFLSIKEQEYLKNKDTINVCILPDLMPLSDMQDSKPQGIVLDLIDELKTKVDININLIKKSTLKDSIYALKNKTCDLIPTLEYREDKKYFNFTQPYLSIPYVAIGKSDKKFFSELSELDGKKISIISDTLLVEKLKKEHPSIEFIITTNINEGLDLVKKSEVYIHLSLYPIARYYLSKGKNSDLKIIGRIIEPLKISIGTRKDEPELLSIMNKFINNIPQSKLDTLLRNWTDVKIHKVVDYSFIYKVFAAIFIFLSLGVWRYRVLKKTNTEIKLVNEKLYNSQKELIKQKEEFEAIFRYSKDGIAILNLNADFIDFNDAYLKILDYKKEELLSKNLIDIIVSEDKEDTKYVIENIHKKSYVDNFEKVCLGKDSRRIFINMSISLMPDENRLLLTAKDLTSMKLLESQSKLASMGEMIGNIAHQWRQPLSIMTTSASGLSLKADLEENVKKEDIFEFSNQIINQAEYLSKTIDDFRNFIKSDMHHSTISIKEALENSFSLTKATITSNHIQCIINIEDDLIIDGNKSELGQVFINIINNAKDKLKEINQNENNRYLFISTKKISENALQVKFLDNGGGIDEKVISKIFEPYFTTKHQSIGTGLGLSMCDKIIRERHTGTIEAYNERFIYNDAEFKGAVFLLTFFL